MSDRLSRATLGGRGSLFHPQKCDAKQPCTTCVDKDRVASCAYGRLRSSGNTTPGPIRSPSRDITPLALSDSSEPSSSHSSSLGLRERSLTPPEQPEREPSPHSLDEVVPVPPSNALVVGKAPRPTDHHPHPTIFSFTVLPSIHFQTVPRPLHVPLSDIPPEYTQVSSIAGDDLGMV